MALRTLKMTLRALSLALGVLHLATACRPLFDYSDYCVNNDCSDESTCFGGQVILFVIIVVFLGLCMLPFCIAGGVAHGCGTKPEVSGARVAGTGAVVAAIATLVQVSSKCLDEPIGWILQLVAVAFMCVGAIHCLAHGGLCCCSGPSHTHGVVRATVFRQTGGALGLAFLLSLVSLWLQMGSVTKMRRACHGAGKLILVVVLPFIACCACSMAARILTKSHRAHRDATSTTVVYPQDNSHAQPLVKAVPTASL